jgi:hypothetical protein
MRSHGVANFPDPTTSGASVSFSLKSGSGINATSPSFRAAQETCDKLLPGSGAGSAKPPAVQQAATACHLGGLGEAGGASP